jgi:ketosteroid isomerase-like protein
VLTELSAHDLAELHSYAAKDSALVMSRNWDALAAEYAQDAVRMPPNQPSIQGRERIRRWLEQLPPINSFSFRLQDLRGNGGLAFMRGVYSITVALPDGTTVDDCGKTLLAFQKQPDGSWLCVTDIWNSDLPLPQ